LKKLSVLILIIYYLLVSSGSVFAQTKTTKTPATLSDMVYADLALRGDLNSISVSFSDGKSKDNFGINDAQHWLPASTVKLFVAMYTFKLIKDNKLNLYQTVTADVKNVVPTELVTPELPTIQPGESLTIDRLLRQMITQSDNTAYNILLDVVSRKAVTEYIKSIGLTHSAVGSKLNLDTSQTQYEFDDPGYGINTTTADDYTKAFSLILNNKIADAKPLLEILKQQKVNYMLPLFLPKNIVVAHKHGDLDPLYHDGGIIFAKNNNYILSVFSNAGDPTLVAHISQLIYTKDSKLVGAAIEKPQEVSQKAPPIDPLLAEGKIPTRVLAAQTQTYPAQPITAADLGITAQDLSLDQTKELPKINIPADSPWHFIVPIIQTAKRAVASGIDNKHQVDAQSMLIQVAEAKDLASRGKSLQASQILQNVQSQMVDVAKSPGTKTDAQTQINLQQISDTRFQVLSNSLEKTTDENRDEVIKQIAAQAKSTITEIKPNTPLATNATNATQKPLIGEIVDKNDSTIIVKTAGGQEVTIPTSQSDIPVKERQSPVITQDDQGNITTTTPTPIPDQGKTLSGLEIGTTVAVVGSSVGNKFTPTFVLANVPKELAAPQPVTVAKIDTDNNTMVVVENGVYTQVNIDKDTVIKGNDTKIPLDQIKEGDVVVVNGHPLTPTVKTPDTTPTPTNQPENQSTSSASQNNSNKNTPSTSPTPTNTTSGTPTPSSKSTGTPTPTSGKNQITPTPTSIKTTPTPTAQSSSKLTPTPAPKTAPAVTPTPTAAPKVIQSTTIKVIQKQEDTVKPAPTVSKPTPAAPAPAAPAASAPKPTSAPAAAQSTPAPAKK
jgi:beta-lactamase class A